MLRVMTAFKHVQLEEARVLDFMALWYNVERSFIWMDEPVWKGDFFGRF